jgi:uncharacterized protein DUF6174
MRKLLLLVLTLVLSACTTLARAGEPKSEVEQARDKWQAADISHYQVNVDVSCFCAFRDEMPLIVEVKDGEVISLKSATGKELNSTNLQYYERYLTIDKLFSEIEKGFKSEGSEDAADKIEVQYDETYGFPTTINIDFVEQAIDDELYITVSDFQKLP